MSIVKLLDKISSFAHSNHLTENDRQYVEKYVERGQRLNDEGKFSPAFASILENEKFDEFNFRYGKRSIIGFLSEIYAVETCNRFNDNNEQMELAPDNREDQLDGIDVVISKEGWARQYTGQVKTCDCDFTDPLNPTIKIHRDWIVYDKQKVDRLLLVDVEKSHVVQFDYAAFQAYYGWPLFINPYHIITLKEVDSVSELRFRFY